MDVPKVRWRMAGTSPAMSFSSVDLVPMEPRVIDPGLRLELEFLARCNRRDGAENSIY